MRTQRSREGYLLIDHRNSPGVDRDSSIPGSPIVGAGKMAELPTLTCLHCQKVQIMNPARTRARPFCAKCNGYICDACSAIQASSTEHMPFAKKADILQEAALRGRGV